MVFFETVFHPPKIAKPYFCELLKVNSGIILSILLLRILITLFSEELLRLLMNRVPVRKILFFTLLLIPIVLFAQRVDVEALKKTALTHMQAGRYGEAIDQLNKYISALPQEAEAYNLRALCFEQRQEYQYAVLDFRRAVALEKIPTKKTEYENNLRRVQEVWYAILNRKIEGHLRDIAINPNIAFNYLEIGKSYRWMEVWDKAEEWYDQYLLRDDNASADEIIRYTEILAKTGSIVKGERILKKYVERYPEDWRLWSRYGYFTLWLAKYSIAKQAFETALNIKPFFKEAQDGLDIVNRQAYVTQQDPRAFEREFPIDRYYRLLRRNPADIETRYKLVEELIGAERFEEAYQQLQVLMAAQPDDERFIKKWEFIIEQREKNYRDKVEEAKAKLSFNQYDKEALKMIAQYYEYLENYDSAMVVLDRYFESYPDEKDQQLRFRYARTAAWNREFDKSINITDGLLKDYPNNLDYQLFRAQVSIWINRDLELAKEYLTNVLKSRPKDLEANISMGSLKLIEQDYEAAQQYADIAKEIDPANDDVIKLQSNIDWQLMRAEEEKLFAILEQGRSKVLDEDCAGALQYYEDYIAKAEPNVLILKEYGDVLFCAKNYKEALETYNEVLSQSYNYDALMQRAKLYYAMGDSINAVKAFKEVVEEEPDEFEAQLYLADSYAKLGYPDSARAIYNMLLDDWSLDSTQTKMVELRKGWLPITGLAAIFETFPNYVGIAPYIQYYGDNLSFRLFSVGSRLDLGVTNYLTIGLQFGRTKTSAKSESLDEEVIETYFYTGNKTFTTFKGNFTTRITKDLNIGAGFGTTNATGTLSRIEKDAYIRYEKRDTISLSFVYQHSDAALILYSPYLIDNRYYASLFRFAGYYIHYKGLKISSSFQYITVTDNNEGNDFVLRAGAYTQHDLSIGYEYYYTNYKLKSKYYYSPINFESHGIWIDYELEQKEYLRVTLGGKIGYIPYNNFIMMGGQLDFYYQPLHNLLINGRFGLSLTSRDNSSYRSFSGQLTAYWTVF